MALAHDLIIESRVKQTYSANKHRAQETGFDVGDLVYVSTENFNLPKGRARKLMPLFVGPYRVNKASPETSHYQLNLPDELADRQIHPTFHVSRLRSVAMSSRVSRSLTRRQRTHLKGLLGRRMGVYLDRRPRHLLGHCLTFRTEA